MLSRGFPLAVAGNLAEAVKVAGVSVDPGSYMEDAFIRRTAITLQFFDVFKASEVTEYFDRVAATYEGNGVFRLMWRVGVEEDVTVNGKDNSCEVYFTAERSPIVVKLNFGIIDHTSKSAGSTRHLLELIGVSAADRIPSNLKGRLKVTCQFSKEACSRIQSGGLIDATNYSTFVNAVRQIVPADNIEDDFLRFFSSYEAWTEFNRVKTGSSTADRKHSGDAAVSLWPERLISIPTDQRALLQCYLYAAQYFMNLCDSLKQLASDLDDGKFNDNFTLLQKSLDTIIHQDIAVFFIKPTFAALFHTAGGAAGGLTVKSMSDNIDISFTVGTTVGASAA